jgi:hypothetical protein
VAVVVVSVALVAPRLTLQVILSDDAPPVVAPVLPVVATIAAPRLSLEIVAIAAGVFALVQCVLELAVPPELIWLAIIALAASRGTLRERGQDPVLAVPRRVSRTGRRARY